MRARITVVFYQERCDEFVPLHPKVLVGQENKWLKNFKEKKPLKQIMPLSFQDSVTGSQFCSRFQAIKYICTIK